MSGTRRRPPPARAQRPARDAEGVHKRIARAAAYTTRRRDWRAHQVGATASGSRHAAFKQGITPAVRELIHAPSRRTPDQIARAHMRRAWLARPAQVALAHAAPKAEAAAAPVRCAAHTLRDAARGCRARRRAAQGRRRTRTPGWPRSSAPTAAATRTSSSPRRGAPSVPVSLVCAVIEAESSLHQRVRARRRSPTRSRAHPRAAPNLVVTEALYGSTYVQHRNRGEGNQGVGPMQLTAPVPAGSCRQARRLLQARPRTSAPASSAWESLIKRARRHARRPRGPTTARPPTRTPSSSSKGSGTRASRGTRPRRRRTATAATPATRTTGPRARQAADAPHDRAQAHGRVRRQGLPAPAQPPPRRVGDRASASPRTASTASRPATPPTRSPSAWASRPPSTPRA